MDCSPPGSSVPGILQARILEWVAIPFSRGSSQPRDQAPASPAAPALQVESLLLSSKINRLPVISSTKNKVKPKNEFIRNQWAIGNLESATTASHLQAPTQQGKENSFIERKESWDCYAQQRICVFSLAVGLNCCQRREILLLPGGSANHWKWELPLLVFWLYIIEVSVC